jgi:hypothetical protein
MSLSPMTLSIERRERHPYRSLYAEMLLQSVHDALVEATKEASTSIQDSANRPAPAGEDRTRREAKQRTTEAQRPNRDGLRQ